MKFKSMNDLRNLSDMEVEDFLKRYWKTDNLSFYGVFMPNADSPDNYSGTISRVKVPGSSVLLRYPLSDIGPVTFKIPANKHLKGKFYKFNCRLLPTYSNRCQLQILLNTLEEIDEQTYGFVQDRTPRKNTPAQHEADRKDEEGGKHLSPLAYRYQLLEDENTGWGTDIHQLIGVYRQQKDGTFCLDDIRKPDLTKLNNYPKTTFRIGPLPLTKPLDLVEEGQYCLFNWKFTFAEKVNPCEIAVDESKPIILVNPKDLIVSVNKACKNLPAPKTPEKKQTDVCVLIYDILQEANKYNSTPSEVQFSLTDKYLSFQHTGRSVSTEKILFICGLTPTGSELRDEIMYHCHGLREFLLTNNHTILVSNGFFIRFDVDGDRLIPVWLEKADLPRELKISLARNKRFNETILQPFDGSDDTVRNNYKVGLHCVFEDVQNIVFFPNISKVQVKIKGEKTRTIYRKDWVVSKEYQSFIPKEFRDKLTARKTPHSASLPESIVNKKHTSIMFACRRKGNELIGEDEAPVYALLPTTSSFGFPFLMDMDILINKTNFSINRRDLWNKVYAEIAGRLFAKWITDLTQKGEFTPKSIYSIVPKFDECLESHPEEKTFITLFQKGFKEVILNTADKATEKRTDEGKVVERKPEAKPAVALKEHTGKTTRLPKTANGNGKIYVIDTNIFVNCPEVISRMDKNDHVILSAKVVDELDNLKYKMEDKDLRNVQKALKNINMSIDKGNVTMEMSDVSLLPHDFDRHNPDNNILSVVLRHKSESPTLLTSDNGLQIKAKTLGIGVIGLKDFLATHKRAYRKKA